jgi:hypothetical protein
MTKNESFLLHFIIIERNLFIYYILEYNFITYEMQRLMCLTLGGRVKIKLTEL